MTRLTHLYLVTCTPTGLRYCGVTNKPIMRRWRAHVWNAFNVAGLQSKFAWAIQQYGEEAFEIDLLWTYPTREEALHAEICVIAGLGLFTKELNGSVGGEGTTGILGGPWPDHVKVKLKAAAQRRASDPAWIEKMRQVARERAKNPEYRKKLSESLKGKVIPQEMRDRISATLSGRKTGPRTEETKRKISLGHVGKKRSPESIAKMAATQKIRLSDPAARERIAATLRGRKKGPHSPEHCAAISRGKLGKKRNITPEWREKLLANLKKAREARACLSN